MRYGQIGLDKLTIPPPLRPHHTIFSILLCALFLIFPACSRSRKDVGNDDFYVLKGAAKNKKKKQNKASTAPNQRNLSSDIPQKLKDQTSGKTKPVSKIAEASNWEDQNPAAAQLQEKVRQNPDNVEALLELGAYYHGKLLFDKAFAAYQDALKISPANAKCLEATGRLMRDWNQPQAGIEYLKKAVEISPNMIEAWNTLGTLYERFGFYPKAQECYETALKANPNADFIHSNLCFSYLQTGDLTQAIVHGEKAVQLNPDFAVAHNNLGIAYALAGNTAIALRHFQLASPSNPSSALNNLGLVYLGKGRFDEAMQQFMAAARLNPEDPSGSNNYNRARDIKAQNERAIKLYAVEHSKDPAFWEAIRLVLRRLVEFPFIKFTMWPELEEPIILPSDDAIAALLNEDRLQGTTVKNRIEIVAPPQLEEAAFDLANILSRLKYRVTINMNQKADGKEGPAIFYRSGLAQEAMALAHQISDNQVVYRTGEIGLNVDLKIHLTVEMLPAITKLKSKLQ